ncbi:MAG: AAA family ATPase, partial [Ardenticatenales bacterium]|nr:AAA family ATPase [Ardenticatenales bacterium]
GGQLTEAVRRRPYSVILLDEIEKAHPEAFNMLLQIMEDGNLADAKGRRVDFRNTIILMTSNVGADLLQRQASLGFRKADAEQGAKNEYGAMKDKVMDELKRRFRPEFLNRMDNIIVFRSLTKDETSEIVDIMMHNFKALLDERELAINLTDEAKQVLVEKGYDPNYGARPLRRLIQQLIVDPISEGLLAHEFSAGDLIHVDANEERSDFLFRSEPGAAFQANALEKAEELALTDDEDLEEIEELFLSDGEEDDE